MSKVEVYNILRSYPNKKFTSNDLYDLVDINMSTLSANLKKLTLDKLIKYKQNKINGSSKRNYYWWEK